jgi:hypothetical protein
MQKNGSATALNAAANPKKNYKLPSKPAKKYLLLKKYFF